MSAVATLVVWGLALAWLGWRGLVVAFVASLVEYIGSSR